jgi:hypothetical protein
MSSKNTDQASATIDRIKKEDLPDMSWPSVLKKPPQYEIPTKRPKRKSSNPLLRNRNKPNFARRPTNIPNMKNSVYLKGNPVTQITLPHTLPNIFR